MERTPYPSDLTDEQWSILEPLLPSRRPLGRPRKAELRDVVDAILYRNRNGCTWRALPHDLPPWRTAYNYFAKWAADGTWAAINDALRRRARRKARRRATPSAGCIDSRTVKATEVGGERGFDAAKRLSGRKRHLVVDTLGLLLAVVVTGASADDGATAPRVLAKLGRGSFPRLARPWADNKYHNHALYEWVAEHGWYAIEVVSRPAGEAGFRLVKHRWVVERTFAWLGRYRVHSRDYERTTASSEAQVQISMIHLMLGRLAPRAQGSPYRYPRPQQNVAA